MEEIDNRLTVYFFFIAKFLSAFWTVIFAKNANQQTLRFGSFSGLASAARIAVNHIAAHVAKNRVFDHLALLYLKFVSRSNLLKTGVFELIIRFNVSYTEIKKAGVLIWLNEKT